MVCYATSPIMAVTLIISVLTLAHVANAFQFRLTSPKVHSCIAQKPYQIASSSKPTNSIYFPLQLIKPGPLRSTSSPFDEELSSTENGEPENIINVAALPYRGKIQEFARDELAIFVIDMSMPGVTHRIAAVKGVVKEIQPRGKVAVVGCLQGGAKVYLSPTSSILTAKRSLSRLNKSVKGNVAAGIDLSVELAQQALLVGDSTHVTVAILADGKGHGLRSVTSDCDENGDAEICDIELMLSAQSLADKCRDLRRVGRGVDTVLIDTEMLNPNQEWSTEGATLARTCEASYYHAPKIQSNELLRILMETKFGMDEGI